MTRVRERFVPCVVDALASRGGTAFLLLYGSRARGTYNWTSDVDVVVCGAAFEGVRILDRVDLLGRCTLPVPVEPICYTPPEARQCLARGTPTILEALEEGVVLYQEGPVLPELRATFARLKATGRITRLEGHQAVKWRVQPASPSRESER